MNARVIFRVLLMSVCWFFALAGCENKGTRAQDGFTKADSVTETYLALQDTMLQAWNSMIHDDNRKIKSMQHLLHELIVSNPEKQEELKAFQERLDDLASMRYNQQSMSDTEIVSEYDFVSNSLVSELLSLAESQKEFAYNTTLQKLTDSIRAADQRVMNYREEYDVVASRFNAFIERNRNFLKEIDEDSFLEKRPLFEMAAE
jgi:septal ring factor EnvC (AmiA/AmiB activator)